ncbi:MAG TPA: hypothetical protein VFI78_02000 [Salinimicrobium sp.]|nr:hypothetical protein [Salinimicrobium sp.]
MKTEQEYMKDLTEIRSMMERSTKFLSLSGWSGIMAGIYALIGVYIAYDFYFADAASDNNTFNRQEITNDFSNLILLALLILVLAIGTAVFFSYKRSGKTKEGLWNSAARRLVVNMALPLLTGGIFILVLLSKGLLGLIAPVSLIFYGLALLNASKFTYKEVKILGLVEIGLGLVSSYFVEDSLLFWALGFGLVHIVYGIFMHYKYEK